MKQFKHPESSFRELTFDEAKSINGGEPTKKTSFFYDAFYFVTKGIGKIYKAAEEEGLFTRSWWEDFSIDLSS